MHAWSYRIFNLNHIVVASLKVDLLFLSVIDFILKFVVGPSGDQVYGFGSAKRGQLGVPYDNARYMSSPQGTRGLEDINVVCISANGDHTAASSSESSSVKCLLHDLSNN